MYPRAVWVIGATYAFDLRGEPWNQAVRWPAPQPPPPAARQRKTRQTFELMPMLPLEPVPGTPAAAVDSGCITDFAAFRNVTGVTSACVGGGNENGRLTLGAGNLVVVILDTSPLPDSGA
jgi:hypothetical protein